MRTIVNPIKNHKKENKPLILAHRGLVTEYQENTMASILAAVDSPSCDGCEIDIYMTKDDKVVLLHDDELKRLTGVDQNIYDITWDELQELNIQNCIEVDGGIRHYKREEKIPLLWDLLEEIKGEDFLLNIDLKVSIPYAYKTKIGKETARIIRALNVEDQVMCTSFSPFILNSLVTEHKAVHTGSAYGSFSSNPVINSLVMEQDLIGRFVESNVAMVEHSLIDESAVARYHKRNMNIGAYTLFPLTPQIEENDMDDFYAQEVLRLTNLGVDWIETDEPHKVYDLIHGIPEHSQPLRELLPA